MEEDHAGGAEVTPAERIASSDKAEATNMILAGDPTRKIMEWFGWSRQYVDSLRLEVARDFLRNKRCAASRGSVELWG